MTTPTTFDEPTLPFGSVSGARFKSIRAATAVELFERVIGAGHPSLVRGDAWGAFEDRTELIAACALARASDTVYRVQIVVVPERRRLGIGGEMVGLAIDEASRRGARMLVGSHPAGAVEARGLIESLGITSARRVRHDEAEVVVSVGTSAPPTRRGPQ